MALNRENGILAAVFSTVTGGVMAVLSVVQPWVMFNEAVWFPLVTTYQRYAAPVLGLPRLPIGAFAGILVLYAVAKFRQKDDETENT
jgi:hypothetical protein